jgi:hypothetical protein
MMTYSISEQACSIPLVSSPKSLASRFTLCSMEEDEVDEEHPLVRTFLPSRKKSYMLPFSSILQWKPLSSLIRFSLGGSYSSSKVFPYNKLRVYTEDDSGGSRFSTPEYCEVVYQRHRRYTYGKSLCLGR